MCVFLPKSICVQAGFGLGESKRNRKGKLTVRGQLPSSGSLKPGTTPQSQKTGGTWHTCPWNLKRSRTEQLVTGKPSSLRGKLVEEETSGTGAGSGPSGEEAALAECIPALPGPGGGLAAQGQTPAGEFEPRSPGNRASTAAWCFRASALELEKSLLVRAATGPVAADLNGSWPH